MANYPNRPYEKDWLNDYGYALMIIGAVALAMFIGLFLTITDTPNKDPRKGRVYISGNINKVCDGTNLIINGKGTAVIENSKECM
jgi:hypothetical protein